MLEPTAGATWESLYEDFRWRLPSSFNIGTACADEQTATSLALVDVVDGEVREHTFGELSTRSTRLANGLASLGVERGDRVGIMLPQGLAVAIAHLATYKRGAVVVPLTSLFGPAAVRHRLGDSDARVVITDATSLDTVVEVAGELGDLQVIVVGDDVSSPHHRFDDLVATGSARLSAPRTGPDDPALLIYTSGTTGSPKGALHGHRVLLGHLPAYELMFDGFPRAGDRVWTPADWAWIGGLLDAVLPAWYHGRPVVAARRGGFDPEWAFDLVADHHVTASFLPPTALKLMQHVDSPRPELPLRTVMSGGESLGSSTLAWGRDRLGVTINEIYGQTEANLLVGNSSLIWDVRAGSMGRPYPGHQLAILAQDGTLAPSGNDGEIVARAPDPVMMLGYFNQPDATQAAFATVVDETGTAQEWLRTGDVGHVDGDGWFWFSSRDDDVIISAGYRIGPTEIEETILSHPAVANVAVIGVPDEVRGESVKAFVVLVDPADPSPDLTAEIQQLVRSQLAAYEYPRTIEIVTELPMTTTGKIRRRALRERETPVGRESDVS